MKSLEICYEISMVATCRQTVTAFLLCVISG